MKRTLDFIVIGAQKAGTTSLFEYLRRHPEIWIPPSKEAWFFSHDSIYGRGWADYLSTYFGRAPSDVMWGTVTPSYMVGGVYDPYPGSSSESDDYDEHTVPERIRGTVPDVKLVALLRDPVERAYSHYRMQVLNGAEHRSFTEAVEALLTPEQLERSRRNPKEENGYITWGEYGRVLRAYLDCFSPEQIMVTFSSELEDAPEAVLRQMYDFLDVDVNSLPENLGVRYRSGSARRRLAWLKIPEARRSFAQIQPARRLWYAIPTQARHTLDSGYQEAVYRIDLWNRRAEESNDGPDERAAAMLRRHFALDAAILRSDFGVTVPWLSTWGTAEDGAVPRTR